MKVVIYHTNCNDGLFAALCAWQKFGMDALYIPVNYKPIQEMEPMDALRFIFSKETAKSVDAIGNSKYKVQDVTEENYKDVELFVLDYSFPVDHFITHCGEFKSVTVLDHHEKAIKDYCEIFHHIVDNNGWKVLTPFDNCKLIFAEKESGAKLSWMYFNPGVEVPGYIELVSDRDLWKFKLEYTRSFHAGIKTLNESNFRALEQNVKFGINRILDLGKYSERMVNDRIKALKNSNCRFITIHHKGKRYKAGLVNCYLDIASDLCAKIIKDEECKIAIAYNIHRDDIVGCSIRSNNELAMPIAERFGGGGHLNASGFSITLDQLFNILTTGILEA